MGSGVQELKHAAKLREWSAKVAECRGSGIGVKAWCREQGIAFLEHGEIEISNNQVENAIRPIVVGRKNWLFCDTQAGANASAVIFSILETAKANGLNPEAYLNHILTMLPERFMKNPDVAIDDLMPWDTSIRQQFKM